MHTRTSLTQYLSVADKEESDTEYMLDVFTFISKQTFENDANFDPRIAKLIITLSLLGVAVTELIVVFEISERQVQRYKEFCKVYLKQRLETVSV